MFSKDIVNSSHFFETLDEIERQIVNKNKSFAIELMKTYKEFHYNKLSTEYNQLIDKLIDLENQELNSIWLKIIGNFLKAGSIKNVDIISGNPPWVKWSNLPDKYRSELKSTLKIDGLFSQDTNTGGVDLNISVLIAHLSIRERLSSVGALGFLMPDSILFNKSFEGFREFRTQTEDFYLHEVVRWNNNSERPFDPVTLDFGEYYFSFKPVEQTKIYDRSKSKLFYGKKMIHGFNNHFLIVEKEELEEIKKILGKNRLKFRSGVSLIKGGGYLLSYIEKVDENVSKYYIHERVNNRIRKSQKTIEIENEIVYPFIKANQINDNELTSTDLYAIFPYEIGSKQPIDLKIIREKYPRFYNYFMTKDIQDKINSSSSYNKRIQNTKLDLGIFRVGDYTYGERFLITRDNTKSVVSMIEHIKMPWGEFKNPIFDSHINYLTYDELGNNLTRSELERLFKIFTQKGVKLYVENASDSRSISSRLYNDISITD